ncbi:Glycosyltransferase involved in cell wall bisynthesis [Parelusimicrobium proximum]
MYKPLVVIPLYNHSRTLPLVVTGVREYFADILVVDDGSTDDAADTIRTLGVKAITHERNRGKGFAIRSAAAYARKHGFTHILTIDADNQHFASDLKKVSDKAKETPFSIIIGKRDFNTDNVPGSSKFGRSFSAFWARLQTGKKIEDIQSGLRAYPVMLFDYLKLKESRYSFEMEIVIRAVWAGFGVEEIPVSVYYPVKSERVSHFNAFWDNVRISILNTKFTIRAMLPIPHRKYRRDEDDNIVSVNPFRVVIEEFKKKGNPMKLGLSAAWSVFWGTLAVPGLRTMCLMVGIGYFNLNRPVGLTMDKLALIPVVPAVCIEVGHFMRYGKWLTNFNFTTLGYQAPQRIWEWVLGSLVVAPVFAVAVGIIVYIVGKLIRAGLCFNDR